MSRWKNQKLPFLYDNNKHYKTIVAMGSFCKLSEVIINANDSKIRSELLNHLNNIIKSFDVIDELNSEIERLKAVNDYMTTLNEHKKNEIGKLKLDVDNLYKIISKNL